jgi:monoamine oxidase
MVGDNWWKASSVPIVKTGRVNLISISASGLYDQAFVESVIDSFDFDVPRPDDETQDPWMCIDGGSHLLTEGMCNKIATQPVTNKRVTAISIDHAASDINRKMVVQVAGEPSTREYSTVFSTTTLACAQRMDLSRAELHPVVKDAIRGLRYDASTKIAIKFNKPWWIIKGINKGGSASTDRPIRTCVYPSYNTNDPLDSPAILLCSYTWAQDAQRIGGLIGSNGQGKDDQLKELVLRDLALLHSEITNLEELEDSFMEMHAHDWYADPHMSGAFALFGPGQFTNLYPLISRPTAAGNLHFIGEGKSE